MCLWANSFLGCLFAIICLKMKVKHRVEIQNSGSVSSLWFTMWSVIDFFLFFINNTYMVVGLHSSFYLELKRKLHNSQNSPFPSSWQPSGCLSAAHLHPWGLANSSVFIGYTGERSIWQLDRSFLSEKPDFPSGSIWKSRSARKTIPPQSLWHSIPRKSWQEDFPG